ncbi:hypothetical protein, partial [Mucilaginibacter sp.]|uniref:hypothetical protein n=1 Tax=Mucilaginibacter sp. TaxID=1882438 RepID=UPI002ED11FFF
SMVKPKPVESAEATENKKEEPSAETSQPTVEEVDPTTEVPAPKLGFKPRFNAATMKPKPAESDEPVVEKKEETPTEEPQAPVTEAPTPKLGFKPRFNAKAPSKKSEGEE